MVLTLGCRLSSFFLYDILYCASDYHLLTTLLEKNFHPDNDIPSRNLRSVIFFASFRLVSGFRISAQAIAMREMELWRDKVWTDHLQEGGTADITT